jgi:hypothetical protein
MMNSGTPQKHDKLRHWLLLSCCYELGSDAGTIYETATLLLAENDRSNVADS